MSIVIKILALQATWWAAVLFYLSSEHQRLRETPVSATVAWSALIVGTALAVGGVTQVYDWGTAVVYGLMVLMTAWCLLVLATPHLKRPGNVLAWGTGLMLLAGVLG